MRSSTLSRPILVVDARCFCVQQAHMVEGKLEGGEETQGGNVVWRSADIRMLDYRHRVCL